MKIRRTEFAMVPTWVVMHPEMRGQGTRIAVYVAIRVIAFEMPDHDWRSDRELAGAAAIVVGIGAEACRKHMRAMRDAGIICGEFGELITPHDPPPSGDPDGDPGTQLGLDIPTSGDAGTQAPITTRAKRNTRPTDEANGDSEPTKAETKALCRAAATGFWDRVQADTGHPPIGIQFMALAKLIERAVVNGGYELAAVKRAVWAVYEGGRPMTLAVIEQYLDGRADSRRRPGGEQQLDALTQAIETERRQGKA